MNAVAVVPVAAPHLSNSPQEIENHISLGQLRWIGPLLFLPARTLLIFLSQCLIAAFYRLQGNASPWQAAGQWWTVWGTLVDIGCLACLVRFTRRENLRFRDLLGPLPGWLLPKSIACFLLVFPFFMLAEPLARRIVYLSWHAPIPHLELMSRHLPLWGILYSLFIWWPICRSRRNSLITATSPHTSPHFPAIAGFHTHWWDSGGPCSTVFFRSSSICASLFTSFSSSCPACSSLRRSICAPEGLPR